MRAAMAAVVGVWMVLGVCGSAAWSAPKEGDEPSQKIYEQTSGSFVVVRYHLKKSGRPHLDGDESELGQRSVLRNVLDGNTMDTIGVILSDQGEIFTSDREAAHWEVVDHITVKGPGGTVVPAKPDRLLVKTSGRILRIEGGLPTSWKPLAFAECERITPQTKFFGATLGMDRHYRLYVDSCRYGRDWVGADGGRDCLQISTMSDLAVLCNGEGSPVGVTCLDAIDLGPGEPAWRGKDILADPGVPDAQLRELERKLQEDFGKNIYEVRIMPRPDPQEDDESEYAIPYRFRSRYMQSEEGQEKTVFALGFAGSKLLIPEGLPKERVAGIDTITVLVDDAEVPARFVGVLKEYAATVIELQEGRLPRTVTFPPDGVLARMEPFWAVYARELGGKDVRTEPSRWINEEQGYKDLWYRVAERSVPDDSWLLDRHGALVGFCAQARHENVRLEPYLLGADHERFMPSGLPSFLRSRMRAVLGANMPYGYATDSRLIDATEMARILGDLSAACDPHIRHLDKDEQKRRVWLGVEYTAPDKEMIKQMGLREPTEDGQIGLMVNRIYEGSPAAALGLTEGDILLTITVPGTPWPIELRSDGSDDSGGPDIDEADIPKEFAAMGYQMPRRRPWPSRDNYLTGLLADIGQGTAVTLRYIHGVETLEKEFTIQQAPRDMLSAAKYKNEKLGLTVKDLTYEVRAALRLKPEEPAVVVTKVEQGTPAALARINAYELIRAVDGTSVDSVATLEKLIADAQQARKDSVRVTVEWMGKTRLADLKFDAKGPAGGFLNSLLQGG
ncbi:MAG: PDZ domain-containing protein [Phycisphaerae bacterium]|nr:PDZ domain-containing protein [Phycisphaerae bacterium]